MKSKTRYEKVHFDIHDPEQQYFEKNYTCLKKLKAILNATEGIEQINLLKEIECYLIKNDTNEDELAFVTDALCIMLYQAPSKSAHKKTLTKIIQELSKKSPFVVEACLHDNITKIINSSNLNISIEEIEKPVIHLIYLLDNLILGKKVLDQNSDKIWIYVSLILKIVIQQLKEEKSSQKRDDWFSLCQNILKLASHIIQNSDYLKSCLTNNSHENFQAATEYIIVSMEYLLNSDETKLNCRLNAAFAYCNYSYISFGVKRLNDILADSSKFSFSSNLCIYSSIMAVLPAEKLINDLGNSSLADKILHGILEISKSSISSEVLLQCARGILQWTNVILNIFNKGSTTDTILMSKIVSMFSDDKEFIKMLFEYVLHTRGHFIDSLRHLSRDIFKNIINLHILCSRTEPKESALLKEMTIYLLKDLPAHNPGKYGMLGHIVEKIGTETILEWDSSLPSELYKVLEEYSLVSHVSELYHVLFRCSLNTTDDETFQKVWLTPLLEVLCKGSKEQTNAVTEHILPKLLLVKPSMLTFLLSELSGMWEKNIGDSFSALVICMKLYQKQKGALSYLNFVSNDSLIKAFFHADDQVRISVFALLCENFKTTEAVDSNTLELIKCGLPYNINCQSPPFRQQLISYMKKLFLRIFESAYSMSKKHQCGKSENSRDLQTILLPNVYQEFLQWLKKYLFSCLNPGANFPRRVTSLNLLYILHEIFSRSVCIVDSEVSVNTLIYTLQDTYDNNRSLALKLLTSESSLILNKQDEKLFKSALILSSSTKPPDTTTAACLFAYIVQSPKCFENIIMKNLFLLSQDATLSFTMPDISCSNCKLYFCVVTLLMHELSKQIEIAKKSLLEAAACAPLYGVLTCIRSVLNNIKIFCEDCYIHWQHLIKELITLSFNVAFVVEPVVCNSSPEGHLPMDTDSESIAQLQAAVRRALGNRFQSAVVIEQPSNVPDTVVLDIVKTHAVTAQLLLLCCWRTHREVSLLFGDLTEKLPLFDPNIQSSAGILSADQMKDIGTYFLHQMSLVKHRGAFEQAHIGLSKMCSRLWKCNIEHLNLLPKMWLEDMILAIKGFKEIQLCPTRRSAGLPFIIQAIVTSEPSVNNSLFFKKTVLTFLDLARPSEEYNADVQVHALNILRTLFRDATLGETVMPFVSEGLKISITGFKSSYWAVRNSSTLLFSALMTRVFGVNRAHNQNGKKNRLSGKSFYCYYKNLYVFIIEELKQCSESIGNKESKFSIEPSVYPILLFLVRLYPAPGEEDTILSAFIPYLKICASSPIWKTRKLAAKALVAFTPQENILSHLSTLIQELNSIQSFIQNEVHGKLLQVFYYLEEIGSIMDLKKNSLKNLFEPFFINSCDLYIKNNKCASTKASFLQIYLYTMALNVEPDSSVLIEILYEEFGNFYSSPDKDNYVATCIAILFLKELESYSIKTPPDLHAGQHSMRFFKYFRNYNHAIINFTVIEILLWLLQEDSSDIKHNLETSEDIVVVQKVLKTVSLIDKKKYNITRCSEEYLQYLLEILGETTDPSLLRQVYKILSCIPSSVSAEWKFLKISHSFDLIDESVIPSLNLEHRSKLQYVLNLIEMHSRDDLTCELLIYSSLLITKLSEEYDSVNKETFFFKQKDVEVMKEWLEKVEECALPDNSILLRNTVVTVLKVLVHKSVFPKSSLLGSLNLWQPLLLVLLDDEPDIKCSASEIIMKMKFPQNESNSISSVVPPKAVDLMLEIFVENNYEDPKHCISMLIIWMLYSDMISYETMTDEQPFDKGELNVFSEDLNLTNTVVSHLSAYLSSLNSPKEKLMLTGSFFCWSDKKSLTFSEIIIQCLSEANVTMKAFLTRGAISPLLDTYFDQDLIYISQRLAVAAILLPFSVIHSDFRTLGSELLLQFQNLDFRTFFIEDIISKIQCFLNQVTVSDL